MWHYNFFLNIFSYNPILISAFEEPQASHEGINCGRGPVRPRQEGEVRRHRVPLAQHVPQDARHVPASILFHAVRQGGRGGQQY